ncbi:Cof-type HAD-IIB family hydrolase [Alkalihalobacillus sp. LMS39]|uniref:Cof-type HAD-IIB family hydrolase n=1 Tax=Alkalihalobacillus sp. LMS39 TaxID=2924032 RepID=UPI001FB445D0|nr:Cof-type HAD-IIB family hydrolase [Alkalihalobacillus sp. LMS39]UOE92014.1 Cof-type HAD-IIB family hydrolase [Alkalihalobacillus sp. LMS39]
MKYKMIVLDMDDTLLQDDHTISERTKKALMKVQDAGVKVVLASGRPTYGMKEMAEELKLADYNSYILSFNGAKIIDWNTKKELYSSSLPPETVHSLYKLSKREDVWIHTYIEDTIVTEQLNPYSEIESKLTGLPLLEVPSFINAVQQPVVKVLMIENPEKLINVEATLKKELAGELTVLRSKPYFLEFTESGVTKGASLKQLIESLGIEQEEVMSFGDSYNDLTMIEFAGLGVAMGNATAEVKEKANYITDSNMNDGVAKVIEKFFNV